MAQVTIPEAAPVESVRELWGLLFNPAGCRSCGQVHLVEASRVGMSCPNCQRAKLESQPALLRQEAPELYLPYTTGRRELAAIYAGFTSGVWLPPDDFNPEALLKRTTPVYWPMWLVDGCIIGDWRAEVGFDYQVQSSQETYTGSGWRTHQQVETRIRWEPRVGQIQRKYDNIPIPAASDHKKLTHLTGHFPLQKTKAYHPGCLDTQLGKGVLRVPDLQPESAWPEAQQNIKKAAAQDCYRASGAQHVRNFAIHADYDELHWTQLLLPVYVTYYTDDDGTARMVYVNGATGKIGGVRLASQRKGWKTAAYVGGAGLLLFLLGVLVTLFSFLFPPLSLVGVLVAAMGLLVAVLAVIPAAWPWQWNRNQQEPPVSKI
jgi:hypothetical protein